MLKNATANYVKQVYVLGISFVMTPVYLAYMGAEAFGLIGFFNMMTAWFLLLDMGLTPTLTRETARYRGAAISVGSLQPFLRALEVVFGAVSLSGAAALVLLAPVIAVSWLKVHELSITEVTQSVILMGLAVPLRWISGLYRGLISGFERQVWLGVYDIIISTVRFICVLSIFVTLGTSPVYFFVFQLAVALVETIGLLVMTYSLVQRSPGPKEKFSWKPLANNMTFSLVIAFAATVWVVVTQSDKLVLSKVLSLADYGVFSIAVSAAGVISSLIGPFAQAMLPRLTKLFAEGNTEAGIELYRKSTQAVLVLATPGVAAVSFLAEPLLFCWTGNVEIARKAARIASLYGIGNGWLIPCTLVYYLQYSKGDLRLHFIATAVLITLFIPSFVLAAPSYGAIGTGAVWAAVNGLFALFWIPIVHARFFKGGHWTWICHDVVPIAAPTLLVGWLLSVSIPWSADRWVTLAELVATGGVLLAVAIAGSSEFRQRGPRLLSSTRLTPYWKEHIP